MTLRKFLEDLRTTGRVRVPRHLGVPPVELEELEAAILVVDEAARSELAGEAPELSVPVASWAALAMFRGCQFLVFRDLGERLVSEVFAVRCPGMPSPSACWSADLTLRYLPDLLALARGIAPSDPLVVSLTRLAGQWPLSSVGIPLDAPIDVSAFIEHGGLRQLYADRIMERSDSARLGEPRVVEAVQASVGAYPELAPRLAGVLSSDTLS